MNSPSISLSYGYVVVVRTVFLWCVNTYRECQHFWNISGTSPQKKQFFASNEFNVTGSDQQNKCNNAWIVGISPLNELELCTKLCIRLGRICFPRQQVHTREMEFKVRLVSLVLQFHLWSAGLIRHDKRTVNFNCVVQPSLCSSASFRTRILWFTTHPSLSMSFQVVFTFLFEVSAILKTNGLGFV